MAARSEYAPREAFIPFHNRSQRWGVVLTHRRAGKTVSLVNDIVLAARTPIGKPRPQYAYLGPTFTQAKRIAWQYLKDYSQPYWAKPPSESELKVNLKGDTTVYCLGADNADSLRGFYLDGAVMDEYAMFRPSVFTQIIRPALSDRHGWGVFASTPRGRNIFYDLFRKAQRYPDEYHLTHLRADTSGLIHQSELAELRRDMDPEEFAQEYLCSFDSALKGAIYANEVNSLFAEGRCYNLEGSPFTPLYDPKLLTNFVYDIGFTDAMVRVAWQVTATGQIVVVNVESVVGADIDYHIGSLHQFADEARKAGGGIGQVWLPHDARAKNVQTGKSVVEQFLAGGIRPQIVPNHKVRDRIAATRKTFPTITIDCTPVSPETPDISVTGDLMEALKAYRREWDEEKMVFSEQPLHDWSSDFSDAFGYMCVVANPSAMTRQSSDMSRPYTVTDSGIVVPSDHNLETLFAQREAQQLAIGSRIM